MLSVFIARDGLTPRGVFYEYPPKGTDPATELTAAGMRLSTLGETQPVEFIVNAGYVLDDNATTGSIDHFEIDATDDLGKFTVKSLVRVTACRHTPPC